MGNYLNSDIKVLIVEDCPEIAWRLSELIADLKNVQLIGPALSCKEAMRLFDETAPDVLLLDLQLPEAGGLNILNIVQDRNPRCVVIVLTDYENDLYRARSMEAGANYFLNKSTEFEKIPQIIETLTAQN